MLLLSLKADSRSEHHLKAYGGRLTLTQIPLGSLYYLGPCLLTRSRLPKQVKAVKGELNTIFLNQEEDIRQAFF